MFGFPHIPRPENSNNKLHFLKGVTFQVRYNTSPILEKRDEIIKLFSAKFPVVTDIIQPANRNVSDKTPIPSTVKNIVGFQLRNNDTKVSVQITNDSLTYVCEGACYKNFESYWKQIDNELKQTLETCSISQVNRIGIRKANVFQFKPDNTHPAHEFLSNILNKDLVSYLRMPGKEYVISNFEVISYKNGNDNLSLIVGLLPFSANDELIGDVAQALDIDAFYSSEKNQIPASDIEKKVNELNQEIYNVFDWAVLPEQKNKMNEV